MLLGFIEATVDLSIDKAIVGKLEKAPAKKLTVRQLWQAGPLKRGLVRHLCQMQQRRLITFATSGGISMDTEVTLGSC